MSALQYPAAFGTVLAVAAVAEGGLRTFATSSMRLTTNDLSGGGTDVPLLTATSATACDTVSTGTSFASPVVAGVAALLFDQIEEDSTVERKPEIAFLVRQALIPGASDGIGGYCSDPAGRDPSYGWGRVDAEGSHLIVSRRLACLADFNLDGVLNSDDLDEFIAAATADPPTPGPGGYAVPASIRCLTHL
jgi:subtilisin family serine protease